jgi:O-antigen/teichoic acid export membrane protein
VDPSDDAQASFDASLGDIGLGGTSLGEDGSTRAPLPEGTIPVGIGLLIAGVTSYLFLKVAKVALGSDEAVQPIASLWIATFALAPGFFLPLEQELARTLSYRRALGQGGHPVVARIRTLAIGLVVLVTFGALALSPLIVAGYFDGDWVLMLALVVAFWCYAPAHLSRGISSGMGRFNAYAIVLGADGAVRIALCATLAIVGVTGVGLYGFAVALSPLPGVIWVKLKGQLRTEPGPSASWGEVTPNLGWLLLGSVFAAALVNAGPLAVTMLATTDQKQLVTRFTYGVLLARIPLFLFQAVQAALLPRLSRLAARNEITEFRAGFARLMKLVLVVGALGTAGAYLLGPLIIERFYDAILSRQTMGMLALGSALYMVALAIAQAVIALRGHALVALGWGIGLATFVIVTWLSSDDLYLRVELGLVFSSLAALVAFAIALRARLRSGQVPSGETMMDAISNMPLES